MTMTSAPLSDPAGPLAETRRTHLASLQALRSAVAHSAQLWRRVSDSDAQVPGLDWTAAETAAHVIGDLRDYTQSLSRYANGYLTHADRAPESPSKLSAALNARHLSDVPDRNLHRLATLLEESAARYLAVASAVEGDGSILTPNGLVITPSTMTGLLLGEQLIHGLDIARATERMWSISPEDARLVIPAVLSVAPNYLRASRAHERVSFEIRIRGGERYRMAVRDGAARVTGAGEAADCTISAEPVAFLLLGYGRVPQWSPLVRGKIRPGGRMPWRTMKFGTLLASP
ncbi:maleylpyruvate isomerase family mycothiol-dependent enzyme [soil metagenome]